MSAVVQLCLLLIWGSDKAFTGGPRRVLGLVEHMLLSCDMIEHGALRSSRSLCKTDRMGWDPRHCNVQELALRR